MALDLGDDGGETFTPAPRADNPGSSAVRSGRGGGARDAAKALASVLKEQGTARAEAQAKAQAEATQALVQTLVESQERARREDRETPSLALGPATRQCSVKDGVDLVIPRTRAHPPDVGREHLQDLVELAELRREAAHQLLHLSKTRLRLPGFGAAHLPHHRGDPYAREQSLIPLDFPAKTHVEAWSARFTARLGQG